MERLEPRRLTRDNPQFPTSDSQGVREAALGIYIHIPFCSSICNYCNFNRGLYDEALKTRYVDALTREISGGIRPGDVGVKSGDRG
ncbi:MAG: hypothetical protein ACRD1V_00765, partial [Vicinamibacterales bacterium]